MIAGVPQQHSEQEVRVGPDVGQVSRGAVLDDPLRPRHRLAEPAEVGQRLGGHQLGGDVEQPVVQHRPLRPGTEHVGPPGGAEVQRHPHERGHVVAGHLVEDRLGLLPFAGLGVGACLGDRYLIAVGHRHA